MMQTSESRPAFAPLWVTIVVLLLVAAGLRFYELPGLPPGLNFDEAGNGVAALDILDGAPRLWWRIGGGKEPAWPYIVATSSLVLGRIPLAIRLPAALIGVLTVAAVYPLLRRMFWGRSGISVALFTMAGVAVSGWHLHFSRLGFRAVLLPLFSTLAFYFFWRGWTESRNKGRPAGMMGHWNDLVSAGLLALAIYSYLAARLLPLVIVGFVVLVWLAQRSAPSGGERRFLVRLLVFLLLGLLPLIVYFIIYPADFVARSAAVSIFNPVWNEGDLIGTAGRTLVLSLGTFLGWSGDENPLVNMPGQPALSWLPALFFLMGFGLSLVRAGRWIVTRKQPAAPSLFLLVWWGIMLMPALLAPEGAPHHLRLIGTLVPTYAFVAMGVVVVTDRLAHWLGRAKSAAYLLPVIFYIVLALQTVVTYFERWPETTDFTLPFDLYAVDLAAQLEQDPADAAIVLPMDIRAGSEARHYTLDYLLDSAEVPYFYLPVTERTAETILTQATADHDQLRVVRWTGDKHSEADAKEIVTYLLQTQATLTGQESFVVYDIENYVVNNGTEFRLPAIDQAINANFDGLLRLDAAYVPDTATAGSWLPVAVTLTSLAPMETDYKASMRLIDPTGARVAQKDRTLQHNFHQGTSLWPRESVNEYYLLQVPADAAPGTYNVVIVLYEPESLVPLVADGVVEVPVGTVEID
jgi:hypothetical protein